MNGYQQLLELTRAQAVAAQEGDFEHVDELLERRAEVLETLPPASAHDAAVIQEIVVLDRQISSVIREKMIAIRDEAAAGQAGRRAMQGYSPRREHPAVMLDSLG